MIEEPPLGTQSRAFVGESLVRRGSYLEHDALRVMGETRVGWIRRQRVLPGLYVKHGEDDDTGFYAPSATGGGDIVPGLLGGTPLLLQAWRNGEKLCVITSGNGRVCTGSARYQRIKQSITWPGSFRQALYYGGRVGSRIQVEYREFESGYTRPSHSERLEFDLRHRATVGHKGAEFEVLEAGEHSLTYQVLSNFSDAPVSGGAGD